MEAPPLSATRSSLQSSLHTCLDGSLKHLSSIWHDIGLSEEQQCDRTKVVLEHIQGLLDDMRNEEEDCRTKLKENVLTLQAEYTKLCSQMSVSEIQFSSDLTLLTRDEELRKHTTALKKEKGQRMQQMTTYKSEEEMLCGRLQLPNQLAGIDCSQVPSLKQLQSWQAIVDDLRQQKDIRSERLLTLQRTVQSLWVQLELDPSTSAESPIEKYLNMDDGVEKLPLTDETEQQVMAIATKLENDLVALVAEANNLRSQISCLYGRLEVTEDEQKSFLEKYGDCRHATVTVLKAELARLEELKRQHMSAFIQTVRNELSALWDQCRFGPMQREQFTPAFSDAEATEELLSGHEAEADRLKQYVADTADIFKLVAKREDLWIRMQELLASASNPNRYNNRGGQLLKEEKMRKAISKELPKVERELQVVVEAYETAQRVKFMIADQRYLDTIAAQWEGLQTKKDTEKTKRATKGKEDVPPATSTTPHKRRPGTTPSSNHCPAKRRAQATPSTGSVRGSTVSAHAAKTPLTRTTSATPSKHGKVGRAPLRATNDMESSMAIAGNIGDPDCTIGSLAVINYREFEATVPVHARCSSMGRPNEVPMVNISKPEK